MNNKDYKRVIVYSILFIALIAGLSAFLYPYFQKLTEPENQAMLQQWAENTGIPGMLFIFAMQIVQVVIAFIPGEPVELLAGVLYGAFGGLALCLAGCALASTCIFLLSKRFGKRMLYRLFKKENVDNWKWLHDGKNIEMITFVLFFIPGTPKDMLTYFIGITEMNVLKFIGISLLARIPSVFSSTLIGANIRQGEWGISLAVFIITGIAGIAGIMFKDKFIAFCKRTAANGKKS